MIDRGAGLRIPLPSRIGYISLSVEQRYTGRFVEGRVCNGFRHIAVGNVNDMHLMRVVASNVHLTWINKGKTLWVSTRFDRDFANDLSLLQIDNEDAVAKGSGNPVETGNIGEMPVDEQTAWDITDGKYFLIDSPFFIRFIQIDN